jgi:NADH:ubiquinone oxidoreductase subunit F (NADH-binding)
MSARSAPRTIEFAPEDPLADRAFVPPGASVLPRLLSGVGRDGVALTLAEHLDVHGALPPKSRRRRREEAPLISQLEQSDLRGHGGAGFPTAKKLRAVAASRGRAIVVVNATEGEPASLKDRALCELTPHLVLDGAQLAAAALDAEEVLVGVCESASASSETIAAAIAERRTLGGAPIELSTVPAGYVSGQESALASYLSGGAALPRFTPPMPFEHGVKRRPTLISNAETYAHIALIARHGARWFRGLGTPSQPGSALVTLSGPLAGPGVYEIEYGAPLRDLLSAAGGTTSPIRAALFGGYAGTWIDGQLLRGLELADEYLAPHGATLGAGVIALISERTCPVAETARIARWLADESAGQCGPCVNGLGALAATLAEIAAGRGEADAAHRTERLARFVRRRGACAHPDGAARFIASSVDVFASEFADHARHGRCEACSRGRELPLPSYARGLPR